MYHPTLGRWMNLGPIAYSGGDVNLYGYEGQNPVNRLDPSGLADYPGSSIGNFLDQLGEAAVLGLPEGIMRDVSPRIEKGGIVLNEGGRGR